MPKKRCFFCATWLQWVSSWRIAISEQSELIAFGPVVQGGRLHLTSNVQFHSWWLKKTKCTASHQRKRNIFFQHTSMSSAFSIALYTAGNTLWERICPLPDSFILLYIYLTDILISPKGTQSKYKKTPLTLFLKTHPNPQALCENASGL